MYSGALSSTFSMHILSLWQEDMFWGSEQQETPDVKWLWMTGRMQQCKPQTAWKHRESTALKRKQRIDWLCNLKCSFSFYLIEFHYVRHVVLLLQLLLPLEQRVHTVVTATDFLIILLLQHGRDAAQAANAASPGAHPAAAPSCWGWLGMNRASSYTQGLSGPTDQLFC